MVENWVYLNAFQDLMRGVRASLEEAYWPDTPMKYFPDARFISSIRMTARGFWAEQTGARSAKFA
jgi:hypothetical protein